MSERLRFHVARQLQEYHTDFSVVRVCHRRAQKFFFQVMCKLFVETDAKQNNLKKKKQARKKNLCYNTTKGENRLERKISGIVLSLFHIADVGCGANTRLFDHCVRSIIIGKISFLMLCMHFMVDVELAYAGHVNTRTHKQTYRLVSTVYNSISKHFGRDMVSSEQRLFVRP